jgi:hypothetical protein
MFQVTPENALLLMVFAHALADYPLQGEFLSKAKANLIPGINHRIAMIMHCIIHAGFVFIITGSVLLFIAEYTLHYAIDTAKVKGKINFEQDQCLHLLCKVLWWFIVLFALN